LALVVFRVAVAGAALLAALLSVAYMIEGVWLRRLPPRALAVRLYRRMRVQARRMGVTAAPGTTPLEFAALLSAALCAARPRRPHPLGRSIEELLTWRERLRRRTAPALAPVARLYSHYQYGRQEPHPQAIGEARRAAERLRRWLWLERLIR
jgi:hypothetical protein